MAPMACIEVGVVVVVEVVVAIEINCGCCWACPVGSRTSCP